MIRYEKFLDVVSFVHQDQLSPGIIKRGLMRMRRVKLCNLWRIVQGKNSITNVAFVTRFFMIFVKIVNVSVVTRNFGDALLHFTILVKSC